LAFFSAGWNPPPLFSPFGARGRFHLYLRVFFLLICITPVLGRCFVVGTKPYCSVPFPSGRKHFPHTHCPALEFFPFQRDPLFLCPVIFVGFPCPSLRCLRFFIFVVLPFLASTPPWSLFRQASLPLWKNVNLVSIPNFSPL